ncbi:MAG: DUF2892 domain-containing protein [Candidatus Woesearchaeota archaeon]|jgi:hypothetical protein
MWRNVGKNDRIIRAILGLIFLYLGYAYSWWFYLLGGLVLLTAIVGFCTIYYLIGIDTL